MRAATASIALSVLLVACGGRGGASPTTSSPGGTTSSSRPTITAGSAIWLAAFRVASDPRDLNADTQALMARVDGSIMVSPAMCFEGLPDGPAPSDYIMGVAAPNKTALEEVVAVAGFPVLWEAQVTTHCID